ncbi:MAG: ATP-binding protein [Pseudomonadota bacterium]|nr:ATP-binding protein [Pseudomonadota bacterium]
MSKSIQRFLTINALSVIGLAILLAIIAVFFLRQESIQVHLDAELSLEARSIESFIVKRLNSRQIASIQDKLNNIPSYPASVAAPSPSQDVLINELINSVQFQVWDLKTNQLILQSSRAPSLPLSSALGYVNVNHGPHLWKTYGNEIPGLNYKIVTMQRYDQRIGYEKQFVTDTLVILFMMLLFLVTAIRTIITRSLTTLEQTTSQLKLHEPSNLTPMSYADTPLEVQPLIIEINRLMTQLKSALEREQQFAADAAHALKTPLAAMKAQIQVINRLPADTKEAAFLEVLSSIDRYDHIIKQLLTLSRTLSRTYTETAHAIELAPLARNVIAPLVPLALQRGINIELHADQNPTIVSNTTLLTTALTNLIENAIKYTIVNDTIYVNITKSVNLVTISVVDHGKGIEDSQKATAIKRFSRLYSENTPGSGLGLSIVEEVCQHLNASLILTNTSPNGLTASIELKLDNGST